MGQGTHASRIFPLARERCAREWRPLVMLHMPCSTIFVGHMFEGFWLPPTGGQGKDTLLLRVFLVAPHVVVCDGRQLLLIYSLMHIKQMKRLLNQQRTG